MNTRRHQKPRLHGIRLVGAVLGLAVLAGCVVEEVKPGRQAADIFVVPDLDNFFFDGGTFHSVKLLFELNGGKDLPEDEYSERIYPRFDQDMREIYKIGDIHRVSFSFREFDVDGFRYPAMTGARLFVLKRRKGDLDLVYRQQRIRVTARGYWTPSIFFYRERGEDADPTSERRISWMKEVLQIGLTRIEADSRQPGSWLVDNMAYAPGSTDLLRLEGALQFDEK